MPAVKENEPRDEYVKRCIPVVISEGTAKDGSQAAAVCRSMWEKAQKKNMQLEFSDIKGKEILYEGDHGEGKVFTENDLDEIIQNFKNKVIDPDVGLEFPPELNLDHDPKLTQRVKDALKVVKLGLVENLYKGYVNKNGKRVANLIADFKSVPQKIAELINSGNIGQRSIEIFRKIKRNGDEKHNVLSAVSFFGKGIPAAQNLEDYIPTLYTDSNSGEKVTIELSNDVVKTYHKEAKMDKIEISTAEYNDLIKMKAEIADLKSKQEKEVIVKLQDTITAKENEVVVLKAENDKLKNIEVEFKTYKDQVCQEKFVMLKNEASAFADTQIAAGKIEPAYKDLYITDYIDKKLKKDSNFELWQKEIEGRKVILPGKLKDNSMSTHAVIDTTILSSTDDMQEEIDKVMAKQNVTWEEARKQILAKVGK